MRTKEQRTAYMKQYNLEHKEQLTQYRLEHKEQNSAYCKQYRLEHKEQILVYELKHKEQKKASDKQYYLEHKEQKTAYAKRYYSEHKEQISAYELAHKEQKLAYQKQYYYGISLEEFCFILGRLQKGNCAICLKPILDNKHAHIDHNHNTGEIRGILCINCNAVLGHTQDNPQILSNAIQYLRH